MEHISRLTTSNVDILLTISDTSRRGLQAAVRINDLAKNLNIGVSKSYLIINQIKEAPSDEVLTLIKENGLELAGTIPEDNDVYEYDLNGRPTIEIPENNKAVKAAFEIFDRIIE
jgi:CO dehydrogenase maturation factor